jgi:DNA-binding PucR family transcriptional regulator
VREIGAHSVWIQDASMLTGIVVLRAVSCSQLEEILPRALRGRVGISPPYRALADTRRQAWLADAARDSAPPGEQCVVCAADDIAAVFIGGALSASQYLAETIAEALGHAREPERARLLETVQAHLDGDGSPTTTARTLYRHRNTVLNHLRRFEELTGLDLSRPADAATAVLALRAVNRFGRER